MLDITDLAGNHALIIGPNCESIIVRLISTFSTINIISDDYDAVINYRMRLDVNDKIKIKIMDYAHTDFPDRHFDLIYAQGSISISERKNILKEIKRVISPEGIICIGEIVALTEPVAEFVKDIWEFSNLDPISSNKLTKFYESKEFIVLSERDHSSALKDFYEKARISASEVDKEEQDRNKKFLARIKHESNAYLKHGGNKFIGFKSLIMRKSN